MAGPSGCGGRPEAPDYGFYRDEWGGDAGEADFSALLPHAVAAVVAAVWPNRPTTYADDYAYRRAVCAAVDADRAYGGTHGVGTGAAGSLTLGSFSASSGGAGGSDSDAYAAELRAAVAAQLVGTGLLFAGFPRVGRPL